MANRKISELQSRTPALSDLMLVGDPSSGYSYKCTVTALATIIETDIADGYVTIGTTQTISGAKTFSNNLTLTSVVNTPTDPDKFLTLNASNVVTYRTGSQVLSDIGAADDTLVVHLAGTETITGFKTFQSRLSIDGSLNLLQGAGINTDAGYSNINASSTGFFLTRAIGVHAFFNLANLTTGRSFTFPDVTGTIALTSDITSALTGYVPTSRTLTINGVTQSLAANRTFNVGTVETVNFATGTTGTDVNVSGSPITTTGTITLNIPTASATNRGALSSTDWSTFNNKQSAISLTTTGNSGAATFVSNTLNIPNYTLSGLGGISGSGTTNYIPKFTSSSAIGNSTIQTDATGNLMVGSSDAGNAGTINVSVGVAGTTAGGLQLWASNSQTHYIQFGDGTTGGQTYAGFLGYAHSADALVFGTNTSERMRLTSGGSLGINTSTPVSTLDVNGGITGRNAFNGYAGATQNLLIDWSAESQVTTLTATNLFFGTNAERRMTITSGGLIGIGTSSPGRKLEIASSNADSRMAITNSVSGGGAAVGLELILNNADASIINYVNGSMIFGTNGSERMRLDASGNLGLGTSNPLNLLHISQASANTIFRLGNNSAYDQFIYFNGANDWSLGMDYSNSNAFVLSNASSIGTNDRLVVTTSGNLGLGVTPSAWNSSWKAFEFAAAAMAWTGGGANDFSFSTNSFFDATDSRWEYKSTGDGAARYSITALTSEHRWYNAPIGTAGNAISFTQAMTLDASGRLGIGVTSMSQKFEVKGSAGSGIRLLHSNNNEIAYIQEFSGVQGAGLGLKKSDGTQTVLFNAGGDSYINGGNVGIGTTSPGNKLTVNGDIAILAGNGIYFNNSVNTANSSIVCQGGGSMSLRSYGTEMIGLSENANILFSTGGTERMRITSGGELLINTTSDAGDYKLQVNGNGYFSGNAAAVQSVEITNASASGFSGLILANTGTSGRTYTLGLGGNTSGQNGNFYIYDNTASATRFLINSSGNAEFSGSIKTAAPSGGTAAAWKLGERVASSGLTLNDTQYIQLDIAGTLYTLATVNLP